MRPCLRIVGVLVLAALASASAGAQRFMLAPAHKLHPAACHGNTSPTSDRAPISHQCCVAGHNHVVPGNSFSGITLLPYFGLTIDGDEVAPDYRFTGRLSTLIRPSVGSPGPTSLRI